MHTYILYKYILVHTNTLKCLYIICLYIYIFTYTYSVYIYIYTCIYWNFAEIFQFYFPHNILNIYFFNIYILTFAIYFLVRYFVPRCCRNFQFYFSTFLLSHKYINIYIYKFVFISLLFFQSVLLVLFLKGIKNRTVMLPKFFKFFLISFLNFSFS